MNKPVNIFIADDVHRAGIIYLNKYFNVFDLKDLNNNKLLKQINLISADNLLIPSALVIRSTRKIDKNFLSEVKKKSNLKLICTVSTGYDNIDILNSAKFGIDVMNVAGANSIAAAEFTIGMILASVKEIIKADNIVKKGEFDASGFRNTELAGKTIGIIGVGRIGSRVAEISKAFGMKISGNDINPAVKKKYRFINFCSIKKLLENSDIVTVHTPLDSSTRYLLNKSNLKYIKNNSVLINCARGGIVEESALINEVKKGRIRYAAIDVFENEPRVNKKLLKLKNIILTPHLAGKTLESKEAMAVKAAKKIAEYFLFPGKRSKLIN